MGTHGRINLYIGPQGGSSTASHGTSPPGISRAPGASHAPPGTWNKPQYHPHKLNRTNGNFSEAHSWCSERSPVQCTTQKASRNMQKGSHIIKVQQCHFPNHILRRFIRVSLGSSLFFVHRKRVEVVMEVVKPNGPGRLAERGVRRNRRVMNCGGTG